MIDPRSVVPTSIMPGYPFLADRALESDRITGQMSANRTVGTPYSDDQIFWARRDVSAQAEPDSSDAEAFRKRYPTAIVRDFDGDPKRLTEMDALIAYLQMLGTTVDFKQYDDKANLR